MRELTRPAGHDPRGWWPACAIPLFSRDQLGAPSAQRRLAPLLSPAKCRPDGGMNTISAPDITRKYQEIP